MYLAAVIDWYSRYVIAWSEVPHESWALGCG
jgi:transposase InsO family protein